MRRCNSVFSLVYDNNSGGITSQLSASDILNDSNVVGTNLQDALNALLVGAGTLEFKREIFTSTQGQTQFTLLTTPVENSELVYINGLRMYPGLSNAYTITDNVITFTEGVSLNAKVIVTYL